MTMKLKHPAIIKSLSLLLAVSARFLRRTIDWRAVYADSLVDPVHPRFCGRFVFAGWHEYMLMPIFLRGHHRMLALASDHSDGQIITGAMHHLGWSVARGSSTRGGVKALFRLLHDNDSHLNLTPDGPRGPRRQMSLGPIVLASKLNLPFVCVGYAYHKPWRLRSWDRFALPRPFSRARAVFGPPLPIPPKLSREGMELYRQWFEDLLNWLTAEAEDWAESGRSKTGSMPMLVKAAPAAMLRVQSDSPLSLPAALNERWLELNRIYDVRSKIAA